MTQEAADRLASLLTGVPSDAPDGSGDPGLVDGARLRTERALAAAAVRSPVPRRRAVRLGIRPRTAALAAVVLVVATGLTLWQLRPTEPAVLVSLASDGTAAMGADPEPVVVHVVGEVRAPGVVRLVAGARVTDAIQAAGGPTERADLAGVNLARPLTDGEQVLVPGPQADGASGPSTLDLNTASVEELDALPGIGPVLAARILTWRTEHGRFSSVDELAEVSGIGPSLLSGLRDLVRV